jgi:hypothetical protein
MKKIMKVDCFSYIDLSDRLKNDREMFELAISKGFDEFNYVPTSIIGDKKYILSLMDKYYLTLHMLPEPLYSDREVTIKAL